MKKQIRYNTFETNSSNVNTLTIMTKEEYKDYIEKWNDPSWVWDCVNETWVNVNESKEYEEFPEEFWDNPCGDYYEKETTKYITEHGDEIVVVSVYGYNG